MEKTEIEARNVLVIKKKNDFFMFLNIFIITQKLWNKNLFIAFFILRVRVPLPEGFFAEKGGQALVMVCLSAVKGAK
jgi:hypothetical protein